MIRQPAATSAASNRSNSVTFAPQLSSSSQDDTLTTTTTTPERRHPRQPRTEAGAGGFTSFLSRATSVTSSSVTDRVSGAVGSVRSAVDSLSSQIQQAVPANLSSASTHSSSTNDDSTTTMPQQQSAASYLASKFSSATGQFTSAASGQSPNPMPVISRQRIVLILDSLAETDWPLHFTNYRRVMAGLAPLSSSSQSTLSSFFSQATAQLSSSASASLNLDTDLIEQVDFRNISILANQSTSTATVFVAPAQQQPATHQSQPLQFQNQPLVRTNSAATKTQQQYRIIRPEYVVVRQRSKDRPEELRSIVNALDYCMVSMFEPIEVWNCFQDRQMLFSKLLRIQKHLGRENFPLIPQVYCQTQQDLLNYINGSSVHSPCLVRLGSRGQGKIRIDNQQMLRDFSTIMATSGLSCTIEPYLDVKCDLVIQKLGANLKSFKRLVRRQLPSSGAGAAAAVGMDEARKGLMSDGTFGPSPSGDQQKQSAFRQTSLGSSVLSSLITSAAASSSSLGNSQQQSPLARRNSSNNSAAQSYEKVSEVNVRYKQWIEAVGRQFDNKIEAFCIKVVVASTDREYIVGMRDCSMDFLGTSDNQEDDERCFVELVISHMNTKLPKQSSLSRETSLNQPPSSASHTQPAEPGAFETPEHHLKGGISHNDKATAPNAASISKTTHEDSSSLADRKKFTSQSQINGDSAARSSVSGGGGGGLGSRSQSVSVNQSDYLKGEQSINKPYFTRRGSDRSDGSLTDYELASSTLSRADTSSMASNSNASGLHQRQSSLGQSFLDQTSTALSSFQKQSMSFFKRFDAQAAGAAAGSNTPPQSAKSDRSFLISSTSAGTNPAVSDIGMVSAAAAAAGGTPRGANGFKSQSIDTPGLDHSYGGKPARRTPPKPPPPPQSLVNRQSSLASSYTSRETKSMVTPNSTPAQTRQNSTLSEGAQQRCRVVRQNSALSAFEPFDPELKVVAATSSSALDTDEATGGSKPLAVDSPSSVAVAVAVEPRLEKPRRESAAKKSGNFDSASITSADSNSTGETVTGEDTMNNLKKTFASIFGDKCE